MIDDKKCNYVIVHEHRGLKIGANTLADLFKSCREFSQLPDEKELTLCYFNNNQKHAIEEEFADNCDLPPGDTKLFICESLTENIPDQYVVINDIDDLPLQESRYDISTEKTLAHCVETRDTKLNEDLDKYINDLLG
jgi:hypothetical protein